MNNKSFLDADFSTTRTGFPFEIKWSKKHKEIADWLRDHAPQMLPPFEGALLLLQAMPIPGGTNFISHAVRDLIQNLPSALDGAQQVMRHAGENYPPKINTIQEIWPNEQGRKTIDADVLIPQSAVASVDDLLQCFSGVTKQITSAEKLARLLVNASTVPIEATQRLIDTFREERKWFVDLAHFTANPRTGVSVEQLIEHFESLCNAIHSIVGSYYVGIDEIDEIIANNNLDDLPKVLSLIGSQHHSRYFFEKLASSAWVGPLNEKGIFKRHSKT